LSVKTPALDINLTSVHHCPVCKEGLLVQIPLPLKEDSLAKDRSVMWACGQAPNCLFSAVDQNGVPHGVYACSRCGRPLNYIDTLETPLWTCSGWFLNPPCKAEYDDSAQKPILGSPVVSLGEGKTYTSGVGCHFAVASNSFTSAGMGPRDSHEPHAVYSPEPE